MVDELGRAKSPETKTYFKKGRVVEELQSSQAVPSGVPDCRFRLLAPADGRLRPGRCRGRGSD